MKTWHIHITNKAYISYRQYRGYVSMGELTKQVRGAISNLAKVGINLDKEGYGKVRVAANLHAIAKLEDGIWSIKDFVKIYTDQGEKNGDQT